MMEQMRKDGLEYDVYTYTGAIMACGQGGQPEKVLDLLDEMVEEHGERVTLDDVLLRSQACAVCVYVCVRLREAKKIARSVRQTTRQQAHL